VAFWASHADIIGATEKLDGFLERSTLHRNRQPLAPSWTCLDFMWCGFSCRGRFDKSASYLTYNERNSFKTWLKHIRYSHYFNVCLQTEKKSTRSCCFWWFCSSLLDPAAYSNPLVRLTFSRFSNFQSVNLQKGYYLQVIEVKMYLGGW